VAIDEALHAAGDLVRQQATLVYDYVIYRESIHAAHSIVTLHQTQPQLASGSVSDTEEVLRRLSSDFQGINRDKFDGVLPGDYHIAFNPLLRRLTGRITYGMRLIEISWFHFREYGYEDARATLEHEMLHLYLHTLRRPSGHTALFKQLAAELDIRVFHANPYPRNRASRDRYLYRCPECERMVFRKRPVERHAVACGECCRTLAGGVWDKRFRLHFVEKIRFA
jgi:SprT-like protein